MAGKKKQGAISRIFGLAAKGVFFLIMAVAKLAAAVLKTAYFIIVKALSLAASSARSLSQKKALNAKKPKAEASFKPLAEVKKLKGSLDDFEGMLFSAKSIIGIIIGARGSGKSALGMRLLENARARGRRVAAMGFSPSAIPQWIDVVEDMNAVENGTFLLVDEGGILFSSRESFSSANKLLSELLLIARHKDLSVLFISQNSSNLEVNTLRQADYLLLKKPSLLQKDFERKIIQKIYEERAADFARFASEGKRITLVYSDAYLGFVESELPGFWSEAASKSFKNYKKS